MPEVRVDPLTGLKSIVTPERATRPGGGLSAEPCPPIDPETDPFLEGHEDRTPPEVYAVRANGSRPDTPGWSVRVVPNLYPALDPDSEAPAPFAKRDLFTATPARGSHEVVVNAPQPVHSLAELDGRPGAARRRRVARADARARRGGRVRPRDRQRAPRGGRVAAPHARADLRARLRPRRRRARARALRRVRAAHDGRQPARRTSSRRRSSSRDRIVAIDDEAVLMVPYGARFPYQLHARAAAAAAALRRRRPDRRGAAARRALAPRAPPRGEPAAEPVGPHGPARRRPLLLAHRHRAAPDAHGRPRARHRRAPQHRRARAGRRRAARRP